MLLCVFSSKGCSSGFHCTDDLGVGGVGPGVSGPAQTESQGSYSVTEDRRVPEGTEQAHYVTTQTFTLSVGRPECLITDVPLLSVGLSPVSNATTTTGSG